MLQLFSPNMRSIMPSVRAPQRDRAAEALAAGTPPKLRADLVAFVGADRVLSRPIDLIRYASDASPYRLFPKVVVAARRSGIRKVMSKATR